MAVPVHITTAYREVEVLHTFLAVIQTVVSGQLHGPNHFMPKEKAHRNH